MRSARSRPATASRGRRATRCVRLGDVHAESLRFHAAEHAAVSVRHVVVIPVLPAGLERVPSRRRDPGARGATRARLTRESLALADSLRAELEAADCPGRLLDGREVAALLARALPGRARGRIAAARCAGVARRAPDDPLERERSLTAAARLRDALCRGAIDASDRRWLAVDGDLEQTLYLSGAPDATFAGWLLHAMQAPRPWTLSVHVRALDRALERRRYKQRYRRLYGVNRGAEAAGHVPDLEQRDHEGEIAELLGELTGSATAGLYELVGLPLAARARAASRTRWRWPRRSTRSCERSAARSTRGCSAASSPSCALWRSSLPLGLDVARRTRRYASTNAADCVPLVGTGCGSPRGLHLGYAEPGRTLERLDPFDPLHDNGTLIVNGKSGRRQDLPGAGAAAAGAGARRALRGDRPLGRPLRVPVRADRRRPPRRGRRRGRPHRQPVGRRGPRGGGRGEGRVPGAAARAADRRPPRRRRRVRAGAAGAQPARARDPRRLRRRGAGPARCRARATCASSSSSAREAEARAPEGSAEVAATYRSLAERLHAFCGEGSYGYLLDRPTTVDLGTAPLAVFDTRAVPEEISPAVLFVLSEFLTAHIERRREAHLRSDGGGGGRAVRGALRARARGAVEADRAARHRGVAERAGAPRAARRAVPGLRHPAALGPGRPVGQGAAGQLDDAAAAAPVARRARLPPRRAQAHRRRGRDRRAPAHRQAPRGAGVLHQRHARPRRRLGAAGAARLLDRDLGADRGRPRARAGAARGGRRPVGGARPAGRHRRRGAP